MAAPDKVPMGGMNASIESCAHAFAITPHDTNDLAAATRGLYLGAAGNVAVITQGGDTITFTAMAAGVFHPLRVSRVKSTGTTATGIIGVY